jgi:acyl-CoA synthetase (AMP-forming)/AMP-acid ligase II
MLSHSNVVENMLSFLNFAGLQTEDQGLIALPLMSSGTNTTEFLAYIHSGITAILYPHGTFSLWNYCNEAKVTSATVANVTPFILNLLAQHAQDVGDLLDGVRKFFCASAPLGARAIRELSRVFPRTQFCYGYGLTEAGPRCTMLDSSMFSLRIGSAGKALRGVEVGVESSAGTATAQGSGEIVIRGPNVMQGYYKSREETNRVLRDSWLHTGDLGHLDPEGFLYVRGRQKNVILCRGVTICPGEVEETLLEHPAIAEAAVTGLPDALEYQKVGAKVVLRPGYKLSEGDLLSFLAARLEMIKCPRQIEFVPALLRNQLHKVTDPSVQGGDFDCF